MFDAKRMECIFIEQYYDNNYSHLVIECIPLGLHVSDLGPIYFKVSLVFDILLHHYHSNANQYYLILIKSLIYFRKRFLKVKVNGLKIKV
jgi:hypothetical protein